MTVGQDDETRLIERAAQWFGVVKEDPSERAAFFAWLTESPRHVDAFLSVLATAQEIAELSSEQRDRIEQRAREAGETMDARRGAQIVPLLHRSLGPSNEHSRPTRSQRRRSRRLPWSAAAGVLALLVGGLVWLGHSSNRQRYATAVGEQRAFELADGSIVHLDTGSRVDVRFSQTQRTVRLIEGQALFKVEHDSARPFTVESGDATIQAIGTQFDVYRRSDTTRVTVLDGLVRIAAPGSAPKDAQLLAAGQNVDIATDGQVIKRPPLVPTDAAAWRQRRLVFREDTLGDIAAEFNRYNRSVQIRVIGEAASEQHFSGTFDADAPQTLMQALKDDADFISERNGREIVIRKR